MDHQGAPARQRWQEAAILVAVTAEAIAQLLLSTTWMGLVRGLLALVLGAALLLRHRHWRWLLPLVAAANAAAMSVTVLIIATYAFATRSSSRLLTVLFALLSALASSVPALVQLKAEPQASIMGMVLTLLIVAASAAIGMYTAVRRTLLAELRQRAEQAESGRAAAEEQARRAERTRIAREMHDIVAHKISLVALQAGALEVNPNLEREQVQQSAALIRGTATTALSELREVLGVLRGDGEQAPLAPQPTWEDVRKLVDESKDAGVAVDLFDFIDDPVPDPLARTAYRVVQEGLTNIHKHARHTKARVALIGEPGTDLVIEVSNVLPKGFTTDLPGARMGLSGIETRVTHAGGTITSGPTDDGRFEVRAVIPWPTTT
ncbi:sensor histidine kinase [Brachybacterium aquaticum]|uniref:histidine kinase n=1 Tax=Brachybacterium aquaticum TaxID=1432564 RepID=A0A841ABC3_9MICO|nr:histidine kinase [Brachybacterium aquaticum]MBB5830494.1 signal transduction histidine kinase [Brachybacterium aquaticum]